MIHIHITSLIPGQWNLKFSLPFYTGVEAKSANRLITDIVDFYFTTFSRFVTWKRRFLEKLHRAVRKAADVLTNNGGAFLLKCIKEDLKKCFTTLAASRRLKFNFLPKIIVKGQKNKLFLFRSRRGLPKDLSFRSERETMKTFLEEVFYDETDAPLPRAIAREMRRFRTNRSGRVTLRISDQHDGNYALFLHEAFTRSVGIYDRVSRSLDVQALLAGGGPNLPSREAVGYARRSIERRNDQVISSRAVRLDAFLGSGLKTECRISDCSVVPIKEPAGKIRIVTPTQWITNAMGDRFRTAVKLSSSAFCVEDSDFDFQILSQDRKSLLYSGDLTRATDNTFVTCVRQTMINVAPKFKNVELCSTFRFDCPKTGLVFVNQRGLPMGTTASFTVLSLLNFSCARAAERATGIRVISFRVVGDDIIALWPQRTIDAYIRNVQLVGYKVNQTKQYIYKRLGVFCERIYTVTGGVLRLFPVQTASIRCVFHSHSTKTVIGWMRPSRLINICASELPYSYKRWLIKRVSPSGSERIRKWDHLPCEWGGTGLIDVDRHPRLLSLGVRQIYSALLQDTVYGYKTVILSLALNPKTEVVTLLTEELANIRPISLTHTLLDDEHLPPFSRPYRVAIEETIKDALRRELCASDFTVYPPRIRRIKLPSNLYKGCLIGCRCSRHREGEGYSSVGSVIKAIRERLRALYVKCGPDDKGATRTTWSRWDLLNPEPNTNFQRSTVVHVTSVGGKGLVWGSNQEDHRIHRDLYGWYTW